jgi:hypothetical protein
LRFRVALCYRMAVGLTNNPITQMRKLQYDPSALLYCHRYKDDDGSLVLVGNDPAIADPTVGLFRWRDVSAGWESRTAWTGGAADLSVIPPAAGARSGWPGAIPLPPRQPGRPRKEVSEDDRPVLVRASIRRAEYFAIMRLAADAQQSVPEWVATILRERLGDAAPKESSP